MLKKFHYWAEKHSYKKARLFVADSWKFRLLIGFDNGASITAPTAQSAAIAIINYLCE